MPELIWDGDCDFCRHWVARWQRITGGAVAYRTAGDASSRYPEIPEAALRRAVQLVETDGSVRSGARAVLGALACRRGGRRCLWLYDRLPGAAWLFERLYRLIAENRSLAMKLTRLFFGA